MQDLGWVCVKTWRFGGKRPVGGFGTREDLFEAYEKASGHVVDPAHVRFWEAYGSVRWGIGCFSMALAALKKWESSDAQLAAESRSHYGTF